MAVPSYLFVCITEDLICIFAKIRPIPSFLLKSGHFRWSCCVNPCHRLASRSHKLRSCLDVYHSYDESLFVGSRTYYHDHPVCPANMSMSGDIRRNDGGSCNLPQGFLLVGLRQLVLGILMSLAIIFVNNAAAPGSVGAVNGLGQTMAAFLRALGPFLAGNIWAFTRFTEMSAASVGAGGAAKAAVGGSGSLMMFISNQLAFAIPTMLIGGLFALVRSMPPSLQYPYTNELESASSAATNVGSNSTTAQEELFDETFLDDSLTRLGATLDDEDSSSQNNATSAGGLNSAVVPSLNASRLTGGNDLYF
eukprot:jgi/Bigna1/72969/fgenesh1_pg.22_\